MINHTKQAAIYTFAFISLLKTTLTFADMNQETLQHHFKTSVISVEAALKQQHKPHVTATAFNQLFICNNTNLPAQSGVTLRVSFPQTGLDDQLSTPGSCAYLTNDYGSFVTQTLIYAPASSGYVVYNSAISSGQMWSVTYDAGKNTYPVAQIQ